MLVDVSAEEGSSVHSLSTEMNALAVKFEQTADSLKAQLDLGRVVVESSTLGRGMCGIGLRNTRLLP